MKLAISYKNFINVSRSVAHFIATRKRGITYTEEDLETLVTLSITTYKTNIKSDKKLQIFSSNR